MKAITTSRGLVGPRDSLRTWGPGRQVAVPTRDQNRRTARKAGVLDFETGCGRKLTPSGTADLLHNLLGRSRGRPSLSPRCQPGKRL